MVDPNVGKQQQTISEYMSRKRASALWTVNWQYLIKIIFQTKAYHGRKFALLCHTSFDTVTYFVSEKKIVKVSEVL